MTFLIKPKITIIFAMTLLLVFIQKNAQVLAVSSASEQLNEAKIYVQRELRKVEKSENFSQEEADIQFQKLQSKLTCIKGITEQNSDLINQVICKQVAQEVDSGLLKRTPIEKATDWMPIIIGGIVIVGIMGRIFLGNLIV